MRATDALICGVPEDWVAYLRRYFRNSALRVEALAGSVPHELLARHVSEHYALILAEAGLEDGLADELRTLRHDDHLVVLIGIQRRRKTSEEVRLLEAGIDDIVDYAAGPEVLGARLRRRICSRGWSCDPHQYTWFGDVEVDIENRRVYKPGASPQCLQLSQTEVLRYFLKNPNRVITQEEMAENVWPDRCMNPSGRNLANLICKLRRNIGDHPPFRFFKTARGGYWLDLPPDHPAAGEDPQNWP